jgi:hypothetical protein
MSSYSENHKIKKQGTELPPVGENILFDFNYAIDLIKGPFVRNILDYPSGIARVGNLIDITVGEIEKRGLNPDYFINEAEKLKEKYKGDILIPLEYLGTFIYPGDPRGKEEYLLILLWFLISARAFIIDKMGHSIFLIYLNSKRGKRELKFLNYKINNLGRF